MKFFHTLIFNCKFKDFILLHCPITQYLCIFISMQGSAIYSSLCYKFNNFLVCSSSGQIATKPTDTTESTIFYKVPDVDKKKAKS